jgi:hypothetical protein
MVGPEIVFDLPTEFFIIVFTVAHVYNHVMALVFGLEELDDFL